MQIFLRSRAQFLTTSLLVLPFLPIVSLLIFLIFFISDLFEKQFYKDSSNHKVIVFLGLVSIISFFLSSIYAYNWQRSALVSFNFLPFILWFFTFPKTGSINQFKFYLKASVFASIPVVIFSILEFAFIKYGSFSIANLANIVSGNMLENIYPTLTTLHPRSMSFFSDPNTLASYLVIVIGILLGFLISEKSNNPEKDPLKANELEQSTYFLKNFYGYYKGFYFLNKKELLIKTYICLIIFSLACTQSRNGIISMAFLIIIALMVSKESRRFLSSLLSFSFILFLFIKRLTLLRIFEGSLIIQSQNIMLSISNLFGVDSRTAIWTYSIHLFQERPFLGWGLGNYQLLYPIQNIGNPMHPHNLWLMLLAETGLLGFISLNIFVGYILYRGILTLPLVLQTEKVTLSCCLMSFLGVLVFHFFDCTFFDFRINMISWLHLAIICSLSQSTEIQ